ncbi:hypothetical protein [Lacipirellula parvula]|uniref:hypothetical protein n=1 Tax=Lacipirellula parvula TaxID=2650471 RepID=UPI001260C9A5|nr:hypothetical protein [Lacipirellula parvula]
MSNDHTLEPAACFAARRSEGAISRRRTVMPHDKKPSADSTWRRRYAQLFKAPTVSFESEKFLQSARRLVIADYSSSYAAFEHVFGSPAEQIQRKTGSRDRGFLESSNYFSGEPLNALLGGATKGL